MSCISRSAVLSLLVTCLAIQVGAQPQANSPCRTHVLSHELFFRVDDPLTEFIVRVKDLAGNVLYDSWEDAEWYGDTQVVSSDLDVLGDCDWFAGWENKPDSPSFNPHTSLVFEFHAYDLELANPESPPLFITKYTLGGRSVGGSNTFYCPNCYHADQWGYQDFYFAYTDGQIKASVTNLVASGGNDNLFIEDFIGNTYIAPYDLRPICDDAAISCPNHNIADITAQLVMRQTGTDVTFSPYGDVVLQPENTFPGPDPRNWNWSDADGYTLRIPEGKQIVISGELTINGSTLFTESSAGSGWDGISVYDQGTLHFDGVTVENAEVGISVFSTGNTFANTTLDDNGIGLLTGYICAANGLCTGTRSHFAMTESCVTNSQANPLDPDTGFGIWARHTNADIESTTIEGNGGYGLFLEHADTDAFDMLVTNNGADHNALKDGARAGANGDLILSSYFGTCSEESFGGGSVCGSGGNAIRGNEEDELSIQIGGSAFIGDICGIIDCPGVNRISDGTVFNQDNRLVGNEDDDLLVNISAEHTFWFDTSVPPAIPPTDAFDHPDEIDYELPGAGNNPLPNAGATDCNPATRESARTSSRHAAKSSVQRGGEPTIDPEDAAWLRERMQRLRSSLATNPESDSALSVLGELYQLQRLDRTDVLGEHLNTTVVLTSLRTHLLNGLMSTRMRNVAEGAFIMLVHDAMHDERNSEARTMLDVFGSRLEGESARRSAALAYAALEELNGNLRSAVDRIEDVLVSLGEGDESLANDLIATIALLERRMGAEPERRVFDPNNQALAQSQTSITSGLSLGDAYPNPFNPETVIPFQLETSAVVRIAVYDALGRKVAVVARGTFDAGVHEARFNGENLPSGTYFIRAMVQDNNETQSEALTQHITLLK